MYTILREIFIYKAFYLMILIVTTQQSESFSYNDVNLSCGNAVDQFLIDEFKSYTEMLITKDFMRPDLYVLRWLKAYNCDLDLAVDKFRKFIEWRNKNNMDSIFLEDFTKLDFPGGMEGFDKDGRPVAWAHAGGVDLRKIALSGEAKKYVRMALRDLDLFETIIHEAGNNISQGIALFDVSGFSVRRFGCLKCLEVLPDLLTSIEEYYPMIYYRAYFINSPKLFDTSMSFMSNFLSETTMKKFQVLNYDKNKWSSVLLEQINKEELSEEYGGTKSSFVINGKSYSPSKGRRALFNNYLEIERRRIQEDRIKISGTTTTSSAGVLSKSSNFSSSTTQLNTITNGRLNTHLSDFDNTNESGHRVVAKNEHNQNHHRHRHYHGENSSTKLIVCDDSEYNLQCTNRIRTIVSSSSHNFDRHFVLVFDVLSLCFIYTNVIVLQI